MGLIFNGVEIPTGVDNTINFNGVNIKTVIFNGVEVWKYVIPYTGIWSGSSDTNGAGFNTSGTAYRIGVVFFVQPVEYGPWLYTTAAGLATGSSVKQHSGGGSAIGFISTPTTLVYENNNYPTSGTVLFSKTEGFSGNSGSTDDPTIFETSGGLVRWGTNAWIGLKG